MERPCVGVDTYFFVVVLALALAVFKGLELLQLAGNAELVRAWWAESGTCIGMRRDSTEYNLVLHDTRLSKIEKILFISQLRRSYISSCFYIGCSSRIVIIFQCHIEYLFIHLAKNGF